ncbi:MAG: PhoH family protein [Deltaproteobacteria bacterium]|jgi:phosphate starvation-inducible PhoH-like protein|nr:PhoH family protein [Deltaproteobacteria bacterium]
MAEECNKQLDFDDHRLANLLFGPQGANLRYLEQKSGLRIMNTGSTLRLAGDRAEQELVTNLLYQIYRMLKRGVRIYPADIEYARSMLEQDPGMDLEKLFSDAVFIGSPKRNITPKTLTQRDYVKALRENDVVFGVGPAGTGKTYLAVAAALSAFLTKSVKRIILTRPAVEAGERLGFLPGDLAEKVNPYLRPLYDALHDMLGFEKVAEMLDSGVIEIAPLAFMRGRTLNDAFIILDEAQNTTPEQMKMFLTRMGFGSRIAVTGDITQIDLPLAGGVERSGMVHALRVLKNVQGMRIVYFKKEDVIRHPLVSKIVEAYEQQSG